MIWDNPTAHGRRGTWTFRLELFTNDDPWDDPPSALWESNVAWNLSNPS